MKKPVDLQERSPPTTAGFLLSHMGCAFLPSIYWQVWSHPLCNFWKPVNISHLSVAHSFPVPGAAHELISFPCFFCCHTAGLGRMRSFWHSFRISDTLMNAERFQSLIILKAQLSKMVHQKSFFWHTLRLPEAALESNTGLCEAAGRDEQYRLWKLCSFFYRKRAEWKQQPWPQKYWVSRLTVPAVQPSDVNSSQVIACSWHWAARQWGGTLHFSRNLWGRNRKLGRTAWEPVFWSSPCHLMVFCALQAVTLFPC